ncbi:MAG: hypothetical protein FJW31_12450 [Acidobacteria bacterium]|nr:hypothetical protein [Acidobacteriota bacterium]
MVPQPPLTLAAATGEPAALPDSPAVYVIHTHAGKPFLGRTNILRRRMTRLFAKWKLAEVATRVEYWLTASRLEQWLLSYRVAAELFPDDYERVLNLPKPAYLKLVLANPYPRTQITTRLAGAQNLFFGPFPARAAADQFEAQLLDLFQLRRCQEDLAPSSEHPGCIYGEMRRCLRPCQQAVSPQEYATEGARIAEFLETRGQATVDKVALQRDRASEQMEFELAAQLHQRHDRIEAVSRQSGEICASVAKLTGVAVTKSIEADTVLLWFLREGCWLDAVPFSLGPPAEGKPGSLDSRLRDIITALPEPRASLALREHHLALLAKWFYSSWRDGEWLNIDKLSAPPYRKLVNAIHRVARG